MIDFTNVFGRADGVFGSFFKGFALVGGVMYFIYALVLIRQTAVMLRAIEESHTTLIRIIAFLQIIVSVIIIVLALTIL